MKKKNNALFGEPAGWSGPPVAVFWEQSLVWGLICVETLRRFSIPFRLLSGADIAAGRLESHRILLVPGGWATHKMRTLGEAGRARIAEFIERGGSYFGFCGGAGLALSSRPALGLVRIERMDLSQRLPSASGEVWVQGPADHPAWDDLPRMIPVSVWWPSQFSTEGLSISTSLATYAATGDDFRVADLPVSDMESHAVSWEEWERVYGINLDPAKLLGHPAILEARSGKGRLILSYPHLETPEDGWGNRLFLNLLAYLDRESAPFFPSAAADPGVPSSFREGASGVGVKASRRGGRVWKPDLQDRGSLYRRGAWGFDTAPGPEAMRYFSRVQESVDGLIRFGERHLLWKWRKPWLLDWRRGIRGLEYGTLAVCIQAILKEAGTISGSEASPDPWLEAAAELDENVGTFCRLAMRLLLEEKLAIQSGNLTKLGKVNETVDQLRARLFGSKMNHGGLCRVIFDGLDVMLFHLLSLPGPNLDEMSG